MTFLTIAFGAMVNVSGGVKKAARACKVSAGAISNYQRGVRKIPGWVMHRLNDHITKMKPATRIDSVKAAHKETSEAIQAGMGAEPSIVAKETLEAYGALWMQLHSVRNSGKL